MNSNSSLPADPTGNTTPAPKRGGPNTLEGKAKSRMNALKHGAYALKVPVLRTESAEAFNQSLNLYYSRYNPADEIERVLVARIAFVDWRLSRLEVLEAHAIDSQMEAIEHSPFTPDGTGQADATLAALNRALQQHCLPYLNRREAALSRLRTRTVKELADLRASQPILDPEPAFMPDALNPGNEPEPDPCPPPSTILLPPFSSPIVNLTKRTPSPPWATPQIHPGRSRLS